MLTAIEKHAHNMHTIQIYLTRGMPAAASAKKSMKRNQDFYEKMDKRK